MTVTDSWLETERYDDAESKFVDAIVTRAESENEMNALVAYAAYDAGFEAGVLASEAGVGRADDPSS